MKKPRLSPPESCPVCGEDVPRNAMACPGCGADHESGWREDADADEFDYEEFVEEEFGAPARRARMSMVWWITAAVLLLAFALFYVLALR